MIQNERQLIRIEIDNVETEKRIDIVRSDGKVKDFWIHQTGQVAIFSGLQPRSFSIKMI